MSEVNPKIIVLVDNFTFYAGGKYVYLCAKAIEPYIANNKIVIEKNWIFQLKIPITAENFSADKLLIFKYLQVEIERNTEPYRLKGADTVRCNVLKFMGYENNYRNFSTE